MKHGDVLRGTMGVSERSYSHIDNSRFILPHLTYVKGVPKTS